MQKISIYLLSILVLLTACEPVRDDNFNLPSPSEAASMEVIALSTNEYIVKDLTSGGFQRYWDFPGGTPSISGLATDTVFYAKKGTYTITLYVSKADGSGTTSVSKQVTVESNAALQCSPKLSLLTGDCLPAGKCWTLSRGAGAVKVGPTYDDYSWFTSLADGLQNDQYDDGFCFTFEGQQFENKNNGASVNPWDGYKAEAYNPGVSSFIFSEGTGISNRDQIIIPNDQFMGTWDSDNVLDVVKLTEDELIVRARLRDKTGVPAAEGWFELTFVKK
ncbi:MAG: PKD domain-containing protein [Saprospiraceae bacterium]|nr:PKD domain-containing protein [Saprospiraceae bacterium]